MLEPIERRIVDFLEETESRDFFGAGDADELRLLSNAISKSSPALYDSVAETVIEKAPCNMAVVRSDLRRLARILSVNAGISLLKNGNPDELLPTFHLSPDDKQRILKLTQEMRGVIHQTNIFDDKHK